MKWNIVADSSCELFDIDTNSEVGFSTVPFTISIDDDEYIDDENIELEKMVDHMEAATGTHTSCPAPESWCNEFMKADNVIAVTISSQLSGSYNSAQTARTIVLEEHPEKNIYIVDSRAAGAETAMIVRKIKELIEQGKSFEQVIKEADEFAEKTHVLFALISYDNLVKNGRMNKFVGLVANKLNICLIGIGSDEGKIEILHKVRGKSKIPSVLLQSMKEKAFAGGKVTISNCQNLNLAEKVKNMIEETWNNSIVDIIPTRGLCSYYAERGGIIIGF